MAGSSGAGQGPGQVGGGALGFHRHVKVGLRDSSGSQWVEGRLPLLVPQDQFWNFPEVLFRTCLDPKGMVGLSLCLRPLDLPQGSTASGWGLRAAAWFANTSQIPCQLDTRETGLNSHESFTRLNLSPVSLGQESRHRCAGPSAQSHQTEIRCRLRLPSPEAVGLPLPHPSGCPQDSALWLWDWGPSREWVFSHQSSFLLQSQQEHLSVAFTFCFTRLSHIYRQIISLLVNSESTDEKTEILSSSLVQLTFR